ncbi:MAG: TonB family protein [Verrucomicrobiota bacterium]
MSVYTAKPINNGPFTATFCGIAAAVAVFLLLPLLQAWIDATSKPPIEVEPSPMDTIPNIVIKDPPKPPIEEKKLEKPDLQEPLPPVPIEMIERALMGPGNGLGPTVLSTDMSGFVNSDELNYFLPDELTKHPKVIIAVSPTYPYAMKGIKGRVVVEFIIDENGRVKRPRIHSSTNRAFNQAAIDSALKSKWQPGEKDGKQVATLVRLPIEFTP